MARYIDADHLLEVLNEELMYESTMFSEEQEEYIKRGIRIAINDVRRFPTEDVVPKSEVERLQGALKAEERHNELTMECAKKSLANSKAEVAMEIFDKVDEIAYRYLNDADYSGGDMVYDLNELKKKYTEEKS